MSWNIGDRFSFSLGRDLTRDDLRRYADASGDVNPIHLDEDFAKSAGFPGVIVHGMLSMAFLGQLIRKHFPRNQYSLSHFQVKFRKVVFPGDTYLGEGEVVALDPVRVEVRVLNKQNEVVTDGKATLKTI